jgi:mono/diheme cytochrome c family protein
VFALAASPAAAAAAGAAARGAYLAAAGGCGYCHTDAPHHGDRYAGGRVLKSTFGRVVAPNITPDPATGIGAWRPRDFAAAMRWGIAPDDSHFLTVFPFPFYNRLTDADLADLAAFLATLRPVRQSNTVGKRAIFAGARNALAVAAWPFPGPWQPDLRHDRQWNRGAYLVATVGRCGDCHTPRNWWGAPDPRLAFAGAPGRGGEAAPNITPDHDTGIGDWSEDDIVALLTDGQTPSFDFVGGAMGEIVGFTAHLDDADRRAIAVYLKSLPAIRNGAPHDAKKG